MKQKIKAVYYYAHWDGNQENKERFVETCKTLDVPFETVDCETPDGVEESIKKGIKMLPMVVFYKKRKEIGRCKGNYAYSEIEYYLK
jgi:hypothetical protein